MQRQPVLAVVRDGALHLYSDDEVQQLRDGDRLVYVKSNPATT
jgi:hypothetical protein